MDIKVSQKNKPLQIQFCCLSIWLKLWKRIFVMMSLVCTLTWHWLDGLWRDRLVIVLVFLQNFLQTRLQSVHCYCNDWTRRLLLSASEVKVVISLVPMISSLYMLNTAILSQIFRNPYILNFTHFQKLYLNSVELLITDSVLLLQTGFHPLAYSNRNGKFLILACYLHMHIFNLIDVELMRKKQSLWLWKKWCSWGNWKADTCQNWRWDWILLVSPVFHN